MILLFDAATDKRIELPYVHWRFGENPDPRPLERRLERRQERLLEKKYVRYTEGSERTYEWRFGTEELGCLQPDRVYRVKLRKLGFGNWGYSKDRIPQTNVLQQDEFEDNSIRTEIVEAALTFASIVEETMEAGDTGPFHRLPRELRDMIYKNLETTEPKILYFRTEAGP